MTDPNIPPSDRPVAPPPTERPVEPVHHTTINNNTPADSGGGGFIPFLVIGLIVVLAIVAWVLFSNGGAPGGDTDVDVKIDVPEMPSLPEAPRLPDAPSLPNVEPPSPPSPSPAPSN